MLLPLYNSDSELYIFALPLNNEHKRTITTANILWSGLEVVVCVALKVLVFEERDLRKESY